MCVADSSPLTGIAPNITAGPADSAVIDGMSVILHCETSGAPRPAITWQKGAWVNSVRLRARAVNYVGLVKLREKAREYAFPPNEIPYLAALLPPPVCFP